MSPEPDDPVLRELHKARAKFQFAIEKIDANRYGTAAEDRLTEQERKTLQEAANRLTSLYGS